MPKAIKNVSKGKILEIKKRETKTKQADFHHF